ncbi:hypothetical protein DMH08_03630 [Actinomadura sp. WAC 06369]|nr:hypothetical protein DMH08_03630 [Actinomadura sp. WAC 06369]
MLGRGKRSSTDKPGKPGKGRKGGKGVLEKDPDEGLTQEEAAERAAEAEEKARLAAERAAKAEEAAEAARHAEEAAARAKEAARLAQIAADAASAEAGADGDADAPEKPGKAATSLEKRRKRRKGFEVAPEGGEAAADDSAASTTVSADAETRADGELTRERTDGDRTDDEDDLAADDEDTDEDTDEDDDLDDLDDEDDSEDDEEEDEDDEDDAETATPSAEADDGESARSSRRRGSPAVVIGVLSVVAAALAAGAVFLGLEVREQQATADARRDAVAAASNAAKALSSYDYRTLETDLKSASATTTGELRGEFDKLAAQLRTQATQQQAVSTTTVLKAGAVSAKPDEVVVLVYANRASATNKDTEARLPEPLRIRMVMVEKDGEWLARKLQVIS